VDLRAASLFRTDLRNAMLWGAHLQRAALSAANLQGARLSGAYLQGAILDEGTFLQGANLSNTELPLIEDVLSALRWTWATSFL
jgi:uncharacterized protein YjbI with pentapeptide repeats